VSATGAHVPAAPTASAASLGPRVVRLELAALFATTTDACALTGSGVAAGDGTGSAASTGSASMMEMTAGHDADAPVASREVWTLADALVAAVAAAGSQNSSNSTMSLAGLSLRSVAVQPGVRVRVAASDIACGFAAEEPLLERAEVREAVELAAKVVLSLTNSLPATFVWVASALTHARALILK